jgi:hypothetical protein
LIREIPDQEKLRRFSREICVGEKNLMNGFMQTPHDHKLFGVSFDKLWHNKREAFQKNHLISLENYEWIFQGFL